MTLFRRTCVANLGGTEVADLRQQFKADHTSDSAPNKLQYTVYNLSPDSRARLSQEKDLTVQIEAGYVDGQTDVIFYGDIERVVQAREGPDWITRLESADGGRALRATKVSFSFKEGVKIVDMIKQIGKQVLVDVGNLADLSQSDFQRRVEEYANGDAIFGKAKDVLDSLCKTGGLDWRVQDGALEVTKKGQPYGTEAVVLAPDSGLIGSPEPGEEGKVRAVSLIQPGLKPRRKVRLVSASIDGRFMVSTVSYTGDTHGTDWYAVLEMVPL